MSQFAQPKRLKVFDITFYTFQSLINQSLFYLTVAASVGDDLNELVKNTVDGAKGLTDQAKQLIKDHVNGANMVQISSMGLFMTVLAIFNRQKLEL